MRVALALTGWAAVGGLQAAQAADHRPAARTTAVPVDAFDHAFATQNEPAGMHFVAEYRDARGTHRLEVWRQGQQRLRRRTDDAIDLLAERVAGDELELQVLDKRRRIVTTVSRGALFKVGHGVDWFSLAHGLAKPRSAYSVRPLAEAPRGQADAQGCAWSELTVVQPERRSAVCWSSALRLPVRIVDSVSGQTVWTLQSTDSTALLPSAFALDTAGAVRVHADDGHPGRLNATRGPERSEDLGAARAVASAMGPLPGC